MRIAHLSMIVLSAVALAGCKGSAEDTVIQPTPVRTAAAFTGPAAPTIHTNGLLANKDEIRLAFKVGGVIRNMMPTKDGDLVIACSGVNRVGFVDVK